MSEAAEVAKTAILECSTVGELKDVQAAIKLRWKQLQQNAVLDWRVGQLVEFTHKGKHHVGMVTRLNQKSIGVDVTSIDGEGQEWPLAWRIGPSALTAVDGD
jgi:uncharacterized protein YkvS